MRKKHTLITLSIVLVALLIRMVYAYDLTPNLDEEEKMAFARTISLDPDTFNLPFGDRISNHTVLSSYITAFGNWLGDGSIYVIRLVFILISLMGVAGLFQLTTALFGHRAANIAILIAALDHFLISSSVSFLEPVYLT